MRLHPILCWTSSGSAVSVPAVYLYIEEIEDETGTVVDMYTAYSDADMTSEALYSYATTVWGEDWTTYIFDGTQDGSAALLYIESDGTIWFGTESLRSTFEQYGAGGTTGWWGYVDGELTFVKKNGDTSITDGRDYSSCEMKTSGDSVTIGFLNGSGNSCVVTITDIGCLAGNTGYDFSTLDGWDAENNLYQYSGILK